MKSTIFLDIDGVLHPDNAAEIVMEGREWNVTGEELFRWAPLLMDLVAPFDAEIVIHSSWRHFFQLHELQAFFPENSRHRVVDVTRGGGRYESILEFTEEHGIDHFLVIDDARSEFPGDWPNLVVCSPGLGVSDLSVQGLISSFLSAYASVDSDPSLKGGLL